MRELNLKRCILGTVSTNCYIVYRQPVQEDKDALKSGVIIDPGDNAPFILNKCKEMKIKPEAILLTHGHFDHILAAEDVRRSFHIPILANEKEMELLEEPSMNLSISFGEPISITADRWLKDGEELELIGSKWKVIHTPGHTAGSQCFYLKEDKMLFSGDTLFQGSVGRTDFPTASYEDIMDSVIRKLFVLPEDTKVYPGHDSETTIGYEKKYNMISRHRW